MRRRIGGTELRTGEGGRKCEAKNNSTSHLPNGHFNGELWIEQPSGQISSKTNAFSLFFLPVMHKQ